MLDLMVGGLRPQAKQISSIGTIGALKDSASLQPQVPHMILLSEVLILKDYASSPNFGSLILPTEPEAHFEQTHCPLTAALFLLQYGSPVATPVPAVKYLQFPQDLALPPVPEGVIRIPAFVRLATHKGAFS
jgi:hypothetical protein